MTPSITNPMDLGHGMKFFIADRKIKPIENIETLPFCEFSFGTLHYLKELINRNITVKMALHDMHPASEIRRIEQFAMTLNFKTTPTI